MQKHRSEPKTPRKRTASERAAHDAREAKVQRVMLYAGLAIVGTGAIAGFFINPAVGAGLLILAVLRLAILWRERRRQQSAVDEPDSKESSRRAGRTALTSHKQARA